MISNLLVVAGLCACCGFGALRTSPSIKNVISESVGNTQVTTPISYGYFHIDESLETSFTAIDFVSNNGISSFANSYLNYSSSVFEGSLVCYNYDQDMIYLDYFPNSNVAGDFSTRYGLVCITHYRHTTSRNYFYVTFGINTSYAKSLSDDGVNVYFDIYTEDFNVDITTCGYEVNYYDSSFMEENLSFAEHLGGVYYNTLTGYDSVGADYDYSPFAFDWQYEFWETEKVEYVTGKRLGFSSSFPNTNTSGFESFNHPFLWNHYVSVISWPSTNDISDTSPFGDDIFVSYSMKGLSASSTGAYQNGYNTGYEEGYYSGVNTAQNGSYQDGYTAGYNAGLSSNNTSWLGLFGAVADTPIMMLRGLFGYELFGINVLSVVLSLFTGLIIFYLLRKLL